MIMFLKTEKGHVSYIKLKDVQAPCVGHVEQKDYQSTVKDAIEFISGRSRRIQKNLSKEMENASKELDYEKAAIARDRIKALTQIQTSQKINQTNLTEADVISIYKETGKLVCKYFFLDLNKIGVIKHFILSMTLMII